jgi:general stress protein 26
VTSQALAQKNACAFSVHAFLFGRCLTAQNREEAIAKLRLLEGIDFCMLTTFRGRHLRSRPMSTRKFEFDDDLWFFTSDKTHKIEEIERDNRVNVAYSQPETITSTFPSCSASLSKDRAKIEKLWSPILNAWFPDGLETPELCLLKVNVEEAEYWDSSSSTLVQVAGFVKAIVTGQQADGGDHGKVNL